MRRFLVHRTITVSQNRKTTFHTELYLTMIFINDGRFYFYFYFYFLLSFTRSFVHFQSPPPYFTVTLAVLFAKVFQTYHSYNWSSASSDQFGYVHSLTEAYIL